LINQIGSRVEVLVDSLVDGTPCGLIVFVIRLLKSLYFLL